MVVKTVPLGEMQANCHIVINENTGDAFIVDPGEYNSELIEALDDSRIKKIHYILLTHGHFDHIGGVAALKRKYSEVPVAIHENDVLCLSDSLLNLAPGFGFPSVEKASADILLHDGDILPFGEDNIYVMHTPGHSKGGVTYRIDDMLFTGDTLFCKTMGRTDLPGGSYDELMASADKLMALLPENYTVYTGHNRKTDLLSEKTGNLYLRRRYK